MDREMRHSSKVSKSTLIYMALILFVFLAYAAIRVINLSEVVQKVKTTADTTAYMRIARESLLESRFFASSRPFVFPLVLKVFGNRGERVVWAQGIFSIVSWGILAGFVAYSLHLSLLRFGAFVIILLFSLHRYIIGWDSVLLTESISLSLMALLMAGWLWLMRGWHWTKAIFILTVVLLWIFSRDTNAWVGLLIALFLFLLLALRQAHKKYLILSFAILIMFFLSNLSADSGGRWVFPFQNILGRRILPNQQAVNFFADCGMPVTPALMQLTGGYANSLDRAFYEDPALEGYRLWLQQAGKVCYVKWLLSRPWESIQAPLLEFNTLISMENIQPSLFSRRFSPVLPARVEAILFPRRLLLFAFVAMSGIVLIAISTRAWVHNKAWWVVIASAMLVFPHYFIVWHGDMMGIFRHVLSASIQFYLAAWLLALFVADRVLSLIAIQETPIRQLFMRSIKQ